MASITQYVEQRLKLRVNREKSVVARALRRPFLGFCFRPRMGEVRVLVDPKALRRAKDRLRALTSRRWGVSMERRIDEINRFTVGWTAYFRLADTPTPFEDLDEWLRRRLRQVRWKEWKRVRTRRRNLRRSASPRRTPANGRARARGTGASRDPKSSPSRCPTATGPPWPAGIPRSLPPLPGCRANRRMRTRTSGGVGGAGVSPAPTRSRRVLSTWRGHAARSHSDGTAPAVAARAAQGHRNRIILLRDALVPPAAIPGSQDRRSAVRMQLQLGVQGQLCPAGQLGPAPLKLTQAGVVFNHGLEAAIRNTKDVLALHVLHARLLLARRAADGELGADPGDREAGAGDRFPRDSFYDSLLQRVSSIRWAATRTTRSPMSSAITSITSFCRRQPHRSTRYRRRCAEAIADMFAIRLRPRGRDDP